MVIPEVLRAHAHQHRRIGIFACPGVIAHAVYRHAPGLGRRGNHLAPRTHAESIAASAVRGTHRQLVFRGAQGGMSRKAPVLAAVNHLLGMLNAHPHGKGLLHHMHALAKQGLHGIPGAMANA